MNDEKLIFMEAMTVSRIQTQNFFILALFHRKTKGDWSQGKVIDLQVGRLLALAFFFCLPFLTGKPRSMIFARI